MKIVHTILASIFFVLLQLCILNAKQKKSINSRPLILLHSSVICSLCSYVIFLWAKNKTVALLFYSLYNLSIPYIGIFTGLLSFSIGNYEKKRAFIKRINFVLLFFSILDLIIYTENIIFGNVVVLLDYVDVNNVHYWIPQYKYLTIYHLCYCYFLVVFIFAVLISWYRKAAVIYKKRYVSLFLELLVCIIFNAISLSLKIKVDFSVIIYCFISCFTSYMIFTAIPTDLINNMMKIVSENINDGIACYDYTGNCIYLNKTARIIFKTSSNGLSKAEDYFNKISNLKNTTIRMCTLEDDFYINDEKHHFNVEFRNFIDNKGRLVGNCLKFNDRTNEIRLLDQEIYNGSHDKLTGLYNRRAFFEKAGEEIEKHPEMDFYLIATDIENFKLVNDLFGTDMGDRILLAQGRMLAAANFGGCVQGRISGDKFAILIPKNRFNQRVALINTRRLQSSIPELKYKIHMYLGIYEIVNREESVVSMYDKACMAIDSIHGDYELSLAFYDSSVNERQFYEKSLISSFEQSLLEKNFKFFFQPLVDAKDYHVVGAESLCRWQHPSFGLIEPEQFLSILEKTDAIYRLDKYNWKFCCELLKEWKAQGKEDLYISVNISSVDFFYGDIYEYLTGLVEEYDIKPSNLRLEITETAIMKNLRRNKGIINKLRSYGFLIEMDDFGSGYASLKTLKDIPMDVLKLDMGFLKESTVSDLKKSIITLIVKLAKKLNMQIVAEGIENEKQAELLKTLDCDVLQGFYFARPMAVNAFELKYMRGKSK